MPTDLPTVALAQMEVRAGRPDLNVESMLRFIAQARDARASIVAFPEMCIPGYILGDTWEVDALVEDYESWSTAIRDASRGIAVVFGNVAIDRGNIGEDGRVRKLNAAWVCHDGELRGAAGAARPAAPWRASGRPFTRTTGSSTTIATSTRCASWPARPTPASRTGRFPTSSRSVAGVVRLGVQLCEDIWHQDYRHCRETLDTLKAWHRAGADLVINLSASPWTWQKNDKRNRVVREAMASSPVPFFYVNKVGAQNNGKNILVFDGDTCAYRTDGSLAGRAPPWREAMLVVEGGRATALVHGESASSHLANVADRAPNAGGRIVSPPEARPAQTEIEAIHDAIVTGLGHLDHLRGRDNRFLVGVSGGIDSSVVACMLRTAFGPERVFAVNMPTRFNARITRENARSMCEALGIDYLSCPIEELYRALSARIEGIGFEREPGTYTRLVDENIQARIRGSDMLAGIASKCGFVFTNNGNKTEVALGYATCTATSTARWRRSRISTSPSRCAGPAPQRRRVPARGDSPQSRRRRHGAERRALRRPGRHQGTRRSIKYGYHDAMLRQMIEYRRHPVDFIEWYRAGELLERIGWTDEERFRRYFPEPRAFVDDLEWLDAQVRVNCFKRIQAPPIIVLSKRAFGFDLRESQLPAYTPHAFRKAKEALLGGG